jgi:anti-sigma factor RsiW
MRFSEFAWRFRYLFCGHPGERQLLLCLDSELSDKRRIYIVKHLERCDRCRGRMAQIEKQWRFLAESASAPGAKSFEGNSLILNIMAAAQAQQFLVSEQADPHKAETDRRLAAVLSIYLGQRAAAVLFQADEATSHSLQERLAGAEAALLTFLGRKGYNAVEMRLLKIMEELPKA